MRRDLLESRYIVGIDLGTTSCSLAYFDKLNPQKGVQTLKILQWESQGTTVSRDVLPSYCFLPSKSEIKKETFKLPFQESIQNPLDHWVCGRYAKAQMSHNADVVVHSAKSWLCHSGIDARDKILPWHSDELVGAKRMSPVEASSLYLKHLIHFWNSEIAKFEDDYQLQDQKIVLTIPASFNELASQLTLEAAKLAGFSLKNLTLLEEPQAVMYSWRYHDAQRATTKDIAQHLKADARLKNLRMNSLSEPFKILVCDVGGGTSDFSLLEVTQDALRLKVKRLEVSNHILLGGDNIDLSIANQLEKKYIEKYGQKKLHSKQWAQLINESRALKEKSLSLNPDDEEKTFYISIAGSGRNIFNSSVSIRLTSSEIYQTILAGFFPTCSPDTVPDEPVVGIQEWGLPYSKDSRISAHLADFLKGRPIDGVLFAGGSLVPARLREVIKDTLQSWQNSPLIELESEHLELSVSRGAAWSGVAHEFQEGQIEGGYPRNLFIEMSSQKSLKKLFISVIPKGFKGDEDLVLEDINGDPIKVLLGQAVSFRMYFSESSMDPLEPGTILSFEQVQQLNLKQLPAIQTQLDDKQRQKKSKRVDLCAVKLVFNLNPTGLLSMRCVTHDPKFDEKSWFLHFNVQDSALKKGVHSKETSSTALSFESSKAFEQATLKINEIYGKAKASFVDSNPNKLTKQLELELGLKKDEWDLEHLRSMWLSLKAGESKRARSESHESHWLNLSGYVLRPGYGDTLDHMRVNELWQTVFEKGLCFPQAKQSQSQWWVFWRRVAGGLSREQQETLFAKIAPSLRRATCHPELFMLAGSLELISMDKKIKLATSLTEQICSKKTQHLRQKIWALARMASRVPLYGGAENVIRPKFVEEWILKILEQKWDKNGFVPFIQFFIQSCRRIGDRELDIRWDVKNQVIESLGSIESFNSQHELITSCVPMDLKSQSLLFGESLPSGFFL